MQTILVHDHNQLQRYIFFCECQRVFLHIYIKIAPVASHESYPKVRLLTNYLMAMQSISTNAPIGRAAT